MPTGSNFLANKHPRWHWVSLVIATMTCGYVLRLAHIPAALLLGPMMAGILVAIAGGSCKIPPLCFQIGQACIGCMIAAAMPQEILQRMSTHGAVFLAAIVSVVLVSSALGWTLTRWRVFPGTTAVWGSSPGAATAMVLMADAHGADSRLVAVMQYTRILLVASVASLVARFAMPEAPNIGQATPLFAPVDLTAFGWALTLMAVSVVIARRFKIAAGALLVPIVLGSAVQHLDWVDLQLPRILLAVAYAVVGVSVGLRFTRPMVMYAARRLPWAVASNLTLIAACGGIAAVLAKFTGVDLMTAYLATSPGGADSIAIIASSGEVDVGFVMAFQTARFILVLLTGTHLARFVARHAVPAAQRGNPGDQGAPAVPAPAKGALPTQALHRLEH